MSLAVVLMLPWMQDRTTAASASPSCATGAGYGGTTGTGTTDPIGGNGCVLIEYNDGTGTVFETFNHTGAVQSWTVPTGVASVRFHLIGAGGGGGRNGTTANGGGGGYATGDYTVTAGAVFDIIVGQGGDRQNGATVNGFSGDTARRNCSYGGGACGQGSNGYGYAFASGGGRSAVRIGGGTDDLVTAGGGGGGGYTYAGGAGGGTTGVSGATTGGGGGTQSAGGAGGGPAEPGTPGIKYAGGYAGNIASGVQANEGGGGGGGYYGGGGAGDNGGGGGGSSYVALLTGGSTTAGSGRNPGLIAPANSSAPTIAGGTSVNSVLTATGGTWNVASGAAWQWQSSSDGVTFTDVSGETGPTFTATQGLKYRVVEFRSNLLGTVQKESNVITITPPPTTTTTTSTTSTSTTTTTTSTTSTTVPQSTTTVPMSVSQVTTTTTVTTTTVVVAAATTTTTEAITTTTTTLPDPNQSESNEGRTKVSQGGSTVFGMPEGGWVKSGASGGVFQVTTSEGLVIQLSAKAKTSTTNSRGMPVFDETDTFQVSVKGLLPNSDTSTWLFSTPTLLGRTKTDAAGSLSAEYPIGSKVPAGDHTAQLNALAPDGTLRSVEVAVEIVDLAADTAAKSSGGGAPPVTAPAAPAGGGTPVVPGGTVGVIAGALVLMGVRGGRGSSAGGRGSARGGRGSSRGAGASDDQGSVDRVDEGGEVAGVGGGYGERAREVGSDRYSPPALARIDDSVRNAADAVATKVPALASIIADGSYLRALVGLAWILVPLAGAVIGVIAAFGVDFTVMLPAWWVVVALLVLSCLDSLAGLAFVATYGVTILLGGGFGSLVSVRGFLGIAVFGFAMPLIAGAVRPFRRASEGANDTWNRLVDVVLVLLFGALAAGSMYGAIPALTTFKPAHADRIGLVQWIVMALLLARWLLENAARTMVPDRLARVENAGFDSPPRAQKVFSLTLRTLLFLFVMVVIIGNNWALWTGGVLFLYPNIVGEFTDRFPNLPRVYRWMPRNLVRTVAMMFVAMWWGSIVTGRLGDRSDAALWAFVIMGIPGQLLGVFDWFAREGEDWESTPVSKVLGIGVLVVGFLMARGYLFS